MKQCFFCDENFDESIVETRVFEGYTIDEEWNDIPIVTDQYLCPRCECWTE